MITGMLKSLQYCRFGVNCTCRREYVPLEERNMEEGLLVDEEDVRHAEELTFYNDGEDKDSFQKVVVEQDLCASDLCQLLAMKNRVAKSVHWSIIEYCADLGLERLVEDHEHLLEVHSAPPIPKGTICFSEDAKFRFIFRKDFRKYEFFHHPHQFFPSNMLDIEDEITEEISVDPYHLKVLISEEAQCPIIFSRMWFRHENTKVWCKSYLLLRDKVLYTSDKVQALARFMRTTRSRAVTKISAHTQLGSEIRFFARLSDYHAYTTLNAKKHFKAPTQWGICLRPSGYNTDDNRSSRLRCLACDSEQVRTCWITAMRLAKYGKQLRENYRAFRNKQTESINPKDYNSYSVPNESVRSRVAMDFTGAVGRIVEDPQEANAIAVAEGYSWKRRWRPSPRGGPGPSAAAQAAAHIQTIEAGVHITQPWFHSGMTRDQATSLVSRYGTVDGVFLVRESRSHPGSFVLTYKCGVKVIHAQINPILDPLRERPVFSLDNGVTKFYDILQLVEFYQLNAGCLPTRLTHYVVQNATAVVPMAIVAQREPDQQQPTTSTRRSSSGGSTN